MQLTKERLEIAKAVLAELHRTVKDSPDALAYHDALELAGSVADPPLIHPIVEEPNGDFMPAEYALAARVLEHTMDSMKLSLQDTEFLRFVGQQWVDQLDAKAKRVTT